MLELYYEPAMNIKQQSTRLADANRPGKPATNQIRWIHRTKKSIHVKCGSMELLYGIAILARYAKDFNQPNWFDEVTFQIQEIYRKHWMKKLVFSIMPGTKAANNAGALRNRATETFLEPC